MRLYLIIGFILLSGLSLIAQTGWYVDQELGNDSNNGRKPEKAFQSFDKAADKANPGDTIFIIGEYHNTSYNPNYVYNSPDDAQLWNAENSLLINGLSGEPDKYIIITSYKGFPDRPAIIKGDGANIVRIRNCSYLKLIDLNIKGEVERIPYSVAKALQFIYIIVDENLVGTPTDPAPEDIRHRDEEGSDTTGIYEDETYPDISDKNVKRPSYTNTRGIYLSTNVNNIEIINDTIQFIPGMGVNIADGKYIKIIGNVIHDCSRRCSVGAHGFAITKTKPVNNGDTSILISRNTIHHNYNEVYSWVHTKIIIKPRIDEGKGLSIQRNNSEEWINGNGRIVVVNNICYWNGYSGLHSNSSYKVDFINNTCFMNSYTNTITYANTDSIGGSNIGISVQKGGNVRMINNISVIDTDWGGKALSAANISNGLFVKNNIIYGINGTVSRDPDITAVEINTLEANPHFIDAPYIYENEEYDFNFGLESNSPAIGYADILYSPAYDFHNRLRDSNPDAGALEFFSTSKIHNKTEEKIKVFPTLFKNFIKIEKQNNEPLNIQIYSIDGKKVLDSKITSNTKIYTDYLSPGIYILKAGTNSFKLIKE